MNGRMYDPIVGRFLSPDPYVQAPTNLQNFNRYSYCLNNPLKYTDPSGEWIHILVGAIIGSVMGTLTANINSLKDGDSFWEAQYLGLAYGIIGGAVGAASAATGGAVAAKVGTTGFVAGAASGAASGAVAGALNGISNTWLNGGDYLEAGTKGFLTGLISGAITGGIGGGISAVRHGGNFWNGDGMVINEFYINSSEITATNDVTTATDETLKTRMYEEFEVKEGDYGIRKITTEGNKNHQITDKGIYKTGKGHSGGFTTYDRSTKSTTLHVSPYHTNADVTTFRAVAGHELIHAYHHYLWGAGVDVSLFSEYVAYKYTYNTYRDGGLFHAATSTLDKAMDKCYIGLAPDSYYNFPKKFGIIISP